MNFDDLMAAAGLNARTYQQSLAEQVCEHLEAGTPVAIAVQATTGVGKTWALAHPALEVVRAGRRVIWSTHTTFLRGQVLATLNAASRAAWPSPGDRPILAERRGRADYPSPSRVMRIRHALADRQAPSEDIALLDALARWPGLIADFTAAFGDLPVAQSLVCLTANCPAEEQADYIAHRDASAAAQIVVQTHALTLIEARFGRPSADLVIFDEADTLPSAAASSVETRVPLDDLVALAEQADADITNAVATLRIRTRTIGNQPLVRRDAAIANAARDIATRYRTTAADAEPELAELLRDTAESLVGFATVDAPKIGAALVQDTAAGPTLAVSAVDAVGWLGSVLKDRQVVLMSATLGRFEEDDLAAACRRLGFWKIEQVHVSPEIFGTMNFCLADRSAPPPFVDGVRDPAFFDYAASMVQQAAATGRTLVLCASYDDASELRERLPDHVIVQQRGERLTPLLERFATNAGSVLVTPAGWAGIDLPHLIDNVVIVRLPMPRPDALREMVLTEALEGRGMSQADARSILAKEGRGDAIRRLTQGMGRGIRAADDRCTIWIADKRFPLPPTAVIDLKRRLAADRLSAWQDMAQAIPKRFRKDGARSAYGRARIVPFTPIATAAE